MILYVAGPMTGYPEFNYPEFRRVASLLSEAGYGVLNPVDTEQHNDTGKPQEWDWYMRHALRMVLEADGLALLSGWGRSRGAVLEHHVATSLGLTCKPWQDWLDELTQ